MLLRSALDLHPDRALDVGTGCGLIAINLSRAGCPFVVGTDVSLHAIQCARANARTLAPRVRFVLTDLFSGLRGSFDLVTFNPPYLPVEGGGIEHTSWAGGKQGRNLIDPFIRGVSRHLSMHGSALLVQSSLNLLDLSRAIAAEAGLGMAVVAQESFFFEKLYVVRLSR